MRQLLRKDINGIDRYAFTTLDEYKAVYTSPKESVAFSNFRPDGEIHMNYRWDVVLKMLNKINDPKRLIDFGSGDGGFCFLLERRGYCCDGVEIDSGVVEAVNEKAAQLNSKCRFFHSSIEEFVSDERYDCAFLLDVLEHFIDPRRALDAVESCLSPNGFVIIATPHIDGCFGSCDPNPFHINLQNEDTLRELIGERKMCMFVFLSILFCVYQVEGS